MENIHDFTWEERGSNMTSFILIRIYRISNFRACKEKKSRLGEGIQEAAKKLEERIRMSLSTL